ncbi:transglutaminase domain-containing protein [Marilutibacter maris]|nr:transglutaminase domain-containing protein [Lysobacter maris]
MRRCSWPLGLALLLASVDAAAAQPIATHQEARRWAQALSVASPYKIGTAALAGQIRYRIAFDGIDGDLPETGEQRVGGTDDTGHELIVCADCGREAAPTPQALAGYTRANAWIESEDPRLRRFATRNDRGDNIDRRMTRLADAVRRHLDAGIDFRHYDSAATAWEKRSGDCTEAALLLAALARARGIPTRVASGLAYSSRFTGRSHLFSPHVWVQAWDGERWRSYDAGLSGFDAGHIAVHVGDGTPADFPRIIALLRGMRIVDAAGVRARTPAPVED